MSVELGCPTLSFFRGIDIFSMKIVLVGGQNVPGIGGAEAYMFNMTKALHALGHDVIIICSNREAYTTMVDDIEIVHKVCPKSNMVALPMLFFKSLGYVYKNRRTIDVVNFQSIFFAFLPGWITALCGCKVCYTIHSLAEDNPKHGKVLKLIMKVMAFISIWCCGKNILTISQSKAKEVKARYGKKCAVVPCGVNMPINIAESDILKRFGLKKGRYYLTIGRIDPIKNLDVLVQAFMKRSEDDFQLVIAGDYANSYGDYLRELAAGNKNIIFVGSVMGADKECLLKNCFVNCLVSSSEGMPISLLEAMAYGKPCIVTDIPAIREVMKDEWGYWCKTKDTESLYRKMQEVERDYERTVAQGEEMASYIEQHHTWDNIAMQYVEYLNMIGAE